MGDDPEAMEFIEDYVLHKEFGLSVKEIEQLPPRKIYGYLFIIDAISKSRELGVMQN